MLIKGISILLIWIWKLYCYIQTVWFFQFRAAILPSWILDYFEKDESQEDARHFDESPPNMSNSSKTPKTPNNSVEVPNPAAAVVTVENCPKSCANKVAPTEVWRTVKQGEKEHITNTFTYLMFLKL